MSVLDKAKHQAEQMIGKAKEAAGRAAGKEDMERAGKRDKVEGKTKEAGQDVKDKAESAVDEAKEKFRDEEDR